MLSQTQSTLESWKPLTKEEYTVFTSINQNTSIADIGIVDGDGISFYLATLQHKWTKAKLEAAFALFPDHPSSVPLVTLNLSLKETNKTAMNDTNIRVSLLLLRLKIVRSIIFLVLEFN